LDAAARQLREACVILLNDQTPDAKLRAAIFARVSAEALTDSIQTIDDLTRRPDENMYFTQLFSHYNGIRRFLPQMFRMINFEANPSAKPVLDAWRFVRDYEGTKKIPWKQAPVTGMTTPWQKVVYDENDQIQQRAYTFWVLIRLHEALRHHDIFVTPSELYNDPRAQLLQGEAWEAVRPQVLRTLDRTMDAEREVRELGEKLNVAYQQTAERWPENTDVRMETTQGKSRVVLTALDKLEEPPSLQTLRSQIQSLLPRIDLPELLLEVNTWTGFADAFTHFSEGGSRVQDLTTSVCAVLIAEACNIGLEPVVQLGVPALTRDRLTWVEQNYFRAETLTQANNKLVEYQSRLQLATTWGAGEVASADGLRFVTSVRTIHAGPNPKYFGAGRGVTYYNFASDQFTGLNGIVIPGTIRDSLYLLDLLLGQQTVLQPQEIMTDTAGYSDIIFGLFGLLGYQFSPRLADIGESRFWRLDPAANYGPFNDLARHRLHPERIVQNWNDMLRVVGSLKLGTVTASRLIRTLQRDGRPTTLGKAIGEYGRIYKTIYLLNYLNDPGYRRRILTQLNRGESRHSLARAVCYGKRGELHQRYKEGQEDQLGALGFVVNAIVLWNTRYMSAALQNLRVQGQISDLTDIKRLSPVGHDHINMVGRYSFTLPEEIAHGDLRPLNRGTADSF
jgi:TnpA family transposase